MFKLQTIRYLIENSYDIPLVLRDKFFGIDTQGELMPEELGIPIETSNPYGPSGNKYLNHVLQQMKIMPGDSIVDLGSGKGSALILFSKYPFRKIAGVELSKQLHQIATDNIKKLDIKNVQLYCIDGSSFQEFDEYNYLYFYNSFTSQILEKVLNNLEKSLVAKPRLFTFIYKNPQLHQEIVDRGYFQKIAEYDSEFEHKFFIYQNQI